MNPITYTVELEPLQQGGFAVRVPALPEERLHRQSVKLGVQMRRPILA